MFRGARIRCMGGCGRWTARSRYCCFAPQNVQSEHGVRNINPSLSPRKKVSSTGHVHQRIHRDILGCVVHSGEAFVEMKARQRSRLELDNHTKACCRHFSSSGLLAKNCTADVTEEGTQTRRFASHTRSSWCAPRSGTYRKKILLTVSSGHDNFSLGTPARSSLHRRQIYLCHLLISKFPNFSAV